MFMLASWKKIFFLLTAVLVLASCSADKEKESSQPENANTTDAQEASAEEESSAEENTAEETAANTEDEDIIANQQPLPQTIQEIVDYPIGEFAGNETSTTDEGVQAKLAEIPAYEESATEEDMDQLLSYLYSLYKMEYEDPTLIVDALQIANSPDSEAMPEEQKTDTFNVEIILDSSGSMANYIGSKTRMDLAKEAIKEFASSLPEEANIGLRVYGHKGTGSDADMQMSCESNELVYDMQAYNEEKLNASLDKFDPAGWTPVAQSLLEAKEDLSRFTGENNQNIIYLVSDGMETCGGDPVAAAKEISDSNVSPVVNIIGFDVNNEGQTQLQDMADAAGGTYVNVKNQEQLTSEFNKTVDNSMKWLSWKASQNMDVLSETVSQQMDIYSVTNGWTMRNYKESGLIRSSLQYLVNEEKLSSEQYQSLVEKTNTYYNNQIQQVNTLQEKLLSLTQENLTNSMEEVNQIYSENVSGD